MSAARQRYLRMPSQDELSESQRQRLPERCKCHLTNRIKTEVQSCLSADQLGRLTLALQPATERPRSAASHAVRRIANEPWYSTDDRSLTSFLRFPAEVRIVIYRMLLRYDRRIEYRVCPWTQQLVLSGSVSMAHDPKFPYWRHHLFPAIMECCKTTAREGQEVLYGENKFLVECDDYEVKYNSWRLPKNWGQLIRYIDLGKDPDTRATLENFTALRSVRISRYWPLEEWEAYVAQTLPVLVDIAEIEIVVTVGGDDAFRFWQLGEIDNFEKARRKRVAEYQGALMRNPMVEELFHVDFRIQHANPQLSPISLIQVFLRSKEALRKLIQG